MGNKVGYTATEVACGWVGAGMKKANSSIWEGAPKNAKNTEKANGDRCTDQPTNIADFGVAYTRVKHQTPLYLTPPTHVLLEGGYFTLFHYFNISLYFICDNAILRFFRQ